MNINTDKITVLYKQYLSNKNNANLIFDKIAKLMIQRKSKNIGEFLSLLTPKITSYDNNLNDTDFIEFMENFSFYMFDTSPDNAVLVLRVILESIQKLTPSKQLLLTKFIWGRHSFRKLICIYPRSNNGKTYMKESLFCSVMPNDGSLMTNLKELMNTFEPIITDLVLSHDLIKYINDIFNKNKGFTYDDPTMIDKNTLSTTDFCVLCFNIVVEILKNIEKNDIHIESYLMDAFWNGVNVVYITTNVMYRNIKDSIGAHQIRLKILKQTKQSNLSEIKDISTHITKGIKMIENLLSYTSTMDTIYINRMIFDNNTFVDNIYKTKKYDIIQRIIFDLAETSTETLIKNSNIDIQIIKMYLSKFIVRILTDGDISVHIKFNAVRLILSHNLKHTLVTLYNGKESLIRYILNDVDRLKHINHVHLIDLLVELSDTTIIESPDVLELYMYLIPEFTDQYTTLIKIFLTIEDDKKPDVINDIGRLRESSSLMISYLPVLGRNALSYINDMFILIETIVNTDSIIKKFLEEEKIDIQKIKRETEIFNDLKKKYTNKIQPIIMNMLSILRSQCEIIITKDSERILCDVIEMNPKTNSDIKRFGIKIIDSNDKSSDIVDVLDVIRCDIALNPYYFVTGDNTCHLIDRKTYFNIIRSKTNPFTREETTKGMLETFNEKEIVKVMRLNILKKIEDIVSKNQIVQI